MRSWFRLRESDARCGVDSGDGENAFGIDDQDSYEFLCDFINTVSAKASVRCSSSTHVKPGFLG